MENMGRTIFAKFFDEYTFKMGLMNGILLKAIEEEIRNECGDIDVLGRYLDFVRVKKEQKFWKTNTPDGTAYSQIDIVARLLFEDSPGERYHALFELKVNGGHPTNLNVFDGRKDYDRINYFLNRNEKRVYISATMNTDLSTTTRRNRRTNTVDGVTDQRYYLEGYVGTSLENQDNGIRIE